MAEASSPRRWSTATLLLLGVVLIWAVAARAGSMTGPFGFGWQHLGALYSLIARNFLRHGPLASRFAMVINVEDVPRDQWLYYTHHPPGMGLAVAGLQTLVGEGPLAVRLLGLAFSLLQVVVTYSLVARALSVRAGIAAAFATAVLPAGAYYATHGSDLGPEAISLALLALLLDERARARDPARPRAGLVLLAAAASLLFDWPVLVVCGWIALRDLVGKRLRRAALFAAIVPSAFALHALHVNLATEAGAGPRGESLLASGLQHGIAGLEELVGQIDRGVLARRLAGELQFLFGEAGLVVALAGLLAMVHALFRRRATDRPDAASAESAVVVRAWGPMLGTAALALLYSVPFPRAVVVHQFWLIVALPWIAFLVGAAVHGFGKTAASRAAWVVVAIASGAWNTYRVVQRQQLDRTPYYEELGAILRERVPPRAMVLTTDTSSECLEYYAERNVFGSYGDARLADFVRSGSAQIPVSGWFAVVRPTPDPAAPPRDRLLEFLASHWVPESIPLPRTGAILDLYDLSRRRDPAPTPPASKDSH